MVGEQFEGSPQGLAKDIVEYLDEGVRTQEDVKTRFAERVNYDTDQIVETLNGLEESGDIESGQRGAERLYSTSFNALDETY